MNRLGTEPYAGWCGETGVNHPLLPDKEYTGSSFFFDFLKWNRYLSTLRNFGGTESKVMRPNNFVRVFTIIAVRAIVLTVIILESVVGVSLASLFWLWAHQHNLISVGYGTVIMAWFWGVLFAGFSFLLAIRITQTFLHINVTLKAWGLSGFFNANWMVLVTEFVMQNQWNWPPHHGVLFVLGAIAVDTVTCICLQSVDHSTYEAADSIVPYTLAEDERERRRHDTADMLNPIWSLAREKRCHIHRRLPLRLDYQLH